MKQTLQLLLLLVCGPIVVAQPTSLEVDQFVYQWLLNHENPAVVGCVVKGQEIIWMDAYGYANVEDDYSATVDTPFMLASVSKTFTGTALLQVIEDNPNVDFSDAASQPSNEAFTLAYTGTLTLQYPLDALYKAIQGVIDASQAINLVIAGRPAKECVDQLQQMARVSNGLFSSKALGYLPHAESVKVL